ncbi:MAG: hypothetical protein Q9204_008828, partial [Flavoplaca sp. TL-2023a]
LFSQTQSQSTTLVCTVNPPLFNPSNTTTTFPTIALHQRPHTLKQPSCWTPSSLLVAPRLPPSRRCWSGE